MTSVGDAYFVVHVTLSMAYDGRRGVLSVTESSGQRNEFELIPTVTRRPASADRTARRQF